MSLRWCLIANPRSGGGRAASKLDAIERIAREALGEVVLWRTEAQGHATALARRAADEGFDRVIAIGGDGTANEVVNGLFDVRPGARPELVRPTLALGVFNAGTGGDLVKTLRMPADPAEAFAAFAQAEPRPVDVMHLRLTRGDGPVERLAINVVGIGMSGAVVERANRSSKRWGGRITFVAATLGAMRTYVPPTVTIRWTTPSGDTGAWTGRLSSTFLANGEFCGGGMWVGRGSSIDDGAVDVTIVPDLPLRTTILDGYRLFNGTMDRVKEVSRVAVCQLVALTEAETPTLVDVDGEQPGFLPLEMSVLPKALGVIRR